MEIAQFKLLQLPFQPNPGIFKKIHSLDFLNAYYAKPHARGGEMNRIGPLPLGARRLAADRHLK